MDIKVYAKTIADKAGLETPAPEMLTPEVIDLIWKQRDGTISSEKSPLASLSTFSSTNSELTILDKHRKSFGLDDKLDLHQVNLCEAKDVQALVTNPSQQITEQFSKREWLMTIFSLPKSSRLGTEVRDAEKFMQLFKLIDEHAFPEQFIKQTAKSNTQPASQPKPRKIGQRLAKAPKPTNTNP